MENRPEPRTTVATAGDVSVNSQLDRRVDIESKQELVVELLRRHECDALLVFDHENFSWLTAGGQARANLDLEASPALYFSHDGRWVVSSNVDMQRIFDEEVDGLGFQLKEWPWHRGRSGLVADLCQGRRIATDLHLPDTVNVADELRWLRLKLTEYEKACYRVVGQVVTHALEATGRTIGVGETEREIAGQLSHRLYHRGAIPLMVSVAVDGRSRSYRQPAFTSMPMQKYCVMTVAARKYGLCVVASRSVCFGQPDAQFRREHDAACKVCATYVASTWPDSVPKQILAGARRVYQLTGFEYEFFASPQGGLIARAPVEFQIMPDSEELLQADWAVSWRACVGAALSCDTFLISEDGPRTLTAAENWPHKRVRIQGSEFVRPDLLIR